MHWKTVTCDYCGENTTIEPGRIVCENCGEDPNEKKRDERAKKKKRCKETYQQIKAEGALDV